MSGKRTVMQRDGRYLVSDDPDGALGCLLGFLTSPVLAAKATASQRFAPDGPGLAVPDNLAAVRARPIDLAELPPELAPADPYREWWVLYLDRPHGQTGGPAVLCIEGSDLRELLRAAGLWSVAPSKGH
jgi:hypothetical protein